MSTDVLSEGMNLQKARYLINYDLHWNPTRMIQRAGRIDRIGSPYQKIYVYNFFPEEELEDLLRLVEILQNKIRNIDSAVGLDSTKTKILDYISCPPEERRVIPDFFERVYDINREIIRDVEASYEVLPYNPELLKLIAVDFIS